MTRMNEFHEWIFKNIRVIRLFAAFVLKNW